MNIVWNRGLNKNNNKSVLKISLTMKKRGVNNFAQWNKAMKDKGLIRSQYPALKKNGDLAELIGVILGDGHINKYPRVDELSIFSNSNNPGFIRRYSDLIEKVFDKKPAITKHGKVNCTRIRIYQKNIQSRINIPYSPRKNLAIRTPAWILNNRSFVVRYLRGLYEAEGCHSVHEKTSTFKVFFTNRNKTLLVIVFRLVKRLSFHPHVSLYQVQLSRKAEVSRFIELIQFRKY